MASVILTYVLWLVGGWLGLHHFYLGRDKQVRKTYIACTYGCIYF